MDLQNGLPDSLQIGTEPREILGRAHVCTREKYTGCLSQLQFHWWLNPDPKRADYTDRSYGGELLGLTAGESQPSGDVRPIDGHCISVVMHRVKCPLFERAEGSFGYENPIGVRDHVSLKGSRVR